MACIATSGTTTSCAFDDLKALGLVCQEVSFAARSCVLGCQADLK